ncbi:MAG: tetratricopeptide repeat protein [Ardenticatenales bacterium]|nr:tetratricopeptide repeat protein [Ardenticatenales bacterium]
MGEEKTRYLLEKQQRFSRSLLWRWQQHYFTEKGVDAWRQGEVPHYITSNPIIATSYAEIVFAFLRDQTRLDPGTSSLNEPLILCELGAGSGRFAFHFLQHLIHLCEQARVPPTLFRYVLTDFAQSNLDFWRQHPRFQPFFERGLLDIALFDVEQPESLALQLTTQVITKESLNRPLVVIANYLFDSIPQDLYYIHEQQCQEGLISLVVEEEPTTLTPAELLDHFSYYYEFQPLSQAPYEEDYLQQLLAEYQQSLADTHLLFPAVGLRCIQQLRNVSKKGLLLLSADKGEQQLAGLQGKEAPSLLLHGSFSLEVNYHAFKVLCEQSDGLALVPTATPSNMSVLALLFLPEALGYRETERAYQRHIQEFGPDDFFTIISHARHSIAEMTIDEILAYLRLAHYDSQQLARYLPRLFALAPTLDEKERPGLRQAIDRVWNLYFPLGEELDLANQIAYLLYAMDDYRHALLYFERSVAIYGQHSGTLYNMALCYELLGQREQAEPLLLKVVQHDPANKEASALLASYHASSDGFHLVQ